MLKNPVLLSALAGLAGASSLSLGAGLGAFWRPGDRLMAFFLALGGGALLAALALDPVARSIKEDRAALLAAGIAAGALAFAGLNLLLNRKGGYLRKPSTAISFWNGKAHERRRKLLAGLARVRILDQLTPRQIDNLLLRVSVRDVAKGTTIYRPGDRAENLYILEEGEVQLLDPQIGRRPIEFLERNGVFGRLSFLTGTLRGTEAVTTRDSRLVVIPRRAFFELLEDFPPLRAAVAGRLQERDVRAFLEERHGVSPDRVAKWLESALAQLRKTGHYDPPDAGPQPDPDFAEALADTTRTDFFRNLGEADRRQIAGLLKARSVPRGHTFYQLGELGQSLYILRQGEVTLLDPADPGRQLRVLGPGNVFGRRSFFGRGPHSATAVASQDCQVLMLRREVFDQAMKGNESLRTAYAAQFQVPIRKDRGKPEAPGKPLLDFVGAAEWTDQAVRGLNRGGLFPSLAEMKSHLESQQWIGTAIILGLLLDALPKGLAVAAAGSQGASISLALLGAIFLSNFPEGLSGANGMREQGFSLVRILALWLGVTAATALVAGLGAFALGSAPQVLATFTEGFAAGALLVIIADTLLPEAYSKGGGLAGLATVAGFLVSFLLSMPR
jgi:CRP-like cAMP-binding protein